MRQDGHAAMRRTLIHQTRGDGGPGRNTGFAVSVMALAGIVLVLSCGDGTTEPRPYFPEPTSVTVSPAVAELTALDATVQLSAEVRDQNGEVMAGATVTWASSAAAATVSASGLVTAVANGSATITATAGSASGSAAVTVAQEVSTVAVAPAEATIAALADTVRIAAEAVDANGNAVAGSEISWETSDAAVAMVDASGLVTAVANGSATITATSGSASGSAVVSVAQEVRTVAVTPAEASIAALGDTLRLTAEAFDANGRAVAGAEFSWASSDVAVARVNASGLVTGVGSGEAEVTATTAGITGRAALTVVAPAPTTVAVTPDTVVLTMVGQTAQLTAEVRDQGGRVMVGVPVAWSSADTTVAVVDSTGLVTAVGGGAATVTATAGEASGDAFVSVMQSVDSVTVSPSADTIEVGDTLRLVAEAYDASGHMVVGASFTWSSSDAAVATVDATGLVRGAGEGAATITATAGDVSVTSEITVTNPDRAALVALYDATDGPNWIDNTNWLTDAPLGEWYGVRTNAAGRVVRLNLSGYWDSEERRVVRHGLRGQLPSELGNLSNLVHLDLRYNALSGAIPSQLGNLSDHLEALILWGNDLSGAIPPEIGNLSNLKTLDLSANDLSGRIPPELGNLSNLEQADFQVNSLSGPIPPELGELSNLVNLMLRSNALLGAIPPELGNLSSLRSLGLSNNALSGAIPPELGNLANLESLDLRWNELSGAIPSEFGNLSSLRSLGLSNNALSGAIPPELGNLANLESLDLRWNELSGAIPSEFGNLSSLRGLYLSRNALGGALPLSLASLSELQWLHYEATNLCVPTHEAFRAWMNAIPNHRGTNVDCLSQRDILAELYRATDGTNWIDNANWLTDAPLGEWYGVHVDSDDRVRILELNDNGLAGRLPAKLGQLGDLTELHIHNNQLTGVIRPDLGNLSSLRILNISANDFWGTLPLALALLPLEEFYYGRTGLCVPLDDGFRAWLNAIPDHNGTNVDCVSDREVLAALYHATDGPNWVDNTNWLTDAPLDEWYGVRTSATGRVMGIDLAGRWDNEAQLGVPHGLTGSIPPELGDLANLESLYLQYNDLSGAIPPELGKLANLRQLWLSVNNLSGAIPPELGNLANLQRLGLSVNNLSGAIPPELGSLANLQWLSLWTNALSGAIPPELGDLANLWTLGLSRNALSGAIPPEMGNIANLRLLDLNDNELSGPIPPELGDLANLESLYLQYNDLSGPIPPELGGLANLEALSLYDNDLSGPIPQGFLQLDRLSRFYISGNEGLCVPGTSAFVAWLENIEQRDGSGTLCNESDWKALESLFERAGGSGWTNTMGWVSGPALEEWHGVRADSLGHVTELDLEGNGLTGRLSGALGNLSRMTVLRIADNADLSGRLPLSLAGLSLQALHYSGTGLCVPDDTHFLDWLSTIRSHEGTGAECPPLSDREVLEIFYDATGGPEWNRSDNWLTNAPLRAWYGVGVDGAGRVSSLEFSNNLTGAIPPELGNLDNLDRLNLYRNNLTGAIPPELGNLGALRYLGLQENNLTGAIPPELGNLGKLQLLRLNDNNLTGPIPPELHNLAKLNFLRLGHNSLTGPIPSELGNFPRLRELNLASNDLSGSVPPELGALTTVRWLALANNAGLTGPLPLSLTGLHSLERLLADGTGLCAPADAVFQAWLDRAYKRRIAPCAAGEPPGAYLTQAVQSREFPVPLVAGETALLRVFATARQANSEGIPLVRARFYVDGRETYVRDIPAKSDPIPTAVVEGDLSRSANAEVPGWVIQPGLEMVIEVDPDNTLDPELGVAKRIPETGRLAVEVKAMPRFDLTVIPFIWTATHDSSIVELVGAMAADPEHHEMLADARTLLPIGDLSVTAHAPVLSSSNNSSALLSQTDAIRVVEGGTGHYMGMMSPPGTGSAGRAYIGGRSSYSQPSPGIIAHEFGHNMSLGHAPCGVTTFLDPSYPYSDGSIGAWGYEFRNGGKVIRPSTSDRMSYCGPRWISDYHFTNALRFRLFDEGAAAAAASPSTPSILLWGGMGADSVPYLEPAFVVDAPAALPDSSGDYRISGRTASGGELFSLGFTMPVTADGDGSSSFAFALPVRPGWGGSLATITLSGPWGSVTLDGESDIPMAILRDPQTGQVRGILRDPPLAGEVAADAVGAAASGLEVLFSRGIPGSADWRR